MANKKDVAVKLQAIFAQDETKVSKDEAEEYVQAVLDAIQEVVVELPVGEKLNLKNFGVFSKKEKAAGEKRNPQTGEHVHVEAYEYSKFSLANAFKDKIKA